MEEQQVLNIVEIGRRIKLVRMDVLLLSQLEFAHTVGATQVQLSRLENGIGATFELILMTINYLNKKGYNAFALFFEHFDLEMISQKSFESEMMINNLQHYKLETINAINMLIDKAKLM